MPRSSIQQRVVAGEMMSDMRCGAPQRRATLRTMSPPGIFERSSRTAHILYSEASSACCALDKREISLSFYFAVLQLVRFWFALSAFGVLSKSLCLATSQQVRTYLVLFQSLLWAAFSCVNCDSTVDAAHVQSSKTHIVGDFASDQGPAWRVLRARVFAL